MIGGTRRSKSIGNSYAKDPLYAYAKAFRETADNILNEGTGDDIFEDAKKVYRKSSSKSTMKRFFIENSNALEDNMSADQIQEHIQAMEEQFENDIEAMHEHSVMADYNPIVGMSIPIHKLVLMNMVFDKGGIQKVTAVSPKFTISIEHRILVTPDGTEIDMANEQNLMTDAINSTSPLRTIELSLPEKGTTDVKASLGGTRLDSLIVGTYIEAVMIPGVVFEVGDTLPNAEGYVKAGNPKATVQTVADLWIRQDIKFGPNYNNSFERVVTQSLLFRVKKDVAGTVTVVDIKETIYATMDKDIFTIVAMNDNVTKLRLKTRLDASNGMLDTCSTKWKVDTSLVEIDTSIPINTTISPEEVKDLAAMYDVNQLTKCMSMYNTVLANYKDDTIKKGLDNDYEVLTEKNKTYNTFDFAPRDGYALDHVEYRNKTFMDFLDNEVTVLLQALNDPNMTVCIYGDPQVVRKITPKEYTFQAPAAIGPVELDYSQTIVNQTDKRLYQFFGSDKMRGSNELMILICPRNSERIVYRIYDYQLYVSNEIRNASNPALPALHAFERFKLVSYQGVQGKVKILNPSGIKTV